MAEKALPVPNEKLVRVFATEQETEALVVRGLIESAGIDCEIGDAENSPDVLPVGGLGLLVRAEDAEKARSIIEEYRRSPEQEAAEEDAFDESAVEATSEETEAGE